MKEYRCGICENSEEQCLYCAVAELREREPKPTPTDMLMELTDEALQAAEELERAEKNVLPHLKDVTIPLDLRWAAYKTLVKSKAINDTKSYGDGYADLLRDDLNLFEDLGYERRQTVTYINLLSTVEDRLKYKPQLTTPERITVWKEAVLASGYAGFEYDW